MKLKQHLFLALIITILLTIALIAGPGASSGYGGLFFLMISPIVWIAFLLWGLILQSIITKKKGLQNVTSYAILTLLIIVMVLAALLTFSSDPDIRSISYEEIFLDRLTLIFFITTSTVYGLLFWLFRKNIGKA
ncbi:hypothetical protein VRU48_02975 [Pedobacter sp. KR3-3]|uniref:Uncharacterized protein n=1 Tax=Pedobacter albus TaxID=3113905 RepID=A0ABU7I3M2_9SPHI|nr:hypothetical protein [Pedobacter sp. KR3-3]MEE1944054.1 hypothetical protein [Pedobacter sp. KR3-3]